MPDFVKMNQKRNSLTILETTDSQRQLQMNLSSEMLNSSGVHNIEDASFNIKNAKDYDQHQNHILVKNMSGPNFTDMVME